MSAPAVPDVLTITVLESATIFEGPDTIYRYDLPGTGIIDGWALAAVIDQARELYSLDWPDVEIIVDADEPTTELLTRTLLNKGVAAYPSEVLHETPLPEPESREVTVTRPTRRAGQHRLRGGISPFHLVTAAVVLVIVGLSLWVVGGPSGAEGQPALPPVPSSSAPGTDPGKDRAGEVTSASREPEPPKAVLEHEHLRVVVPAGFRLEDRGDGLLATGEDPGLRIHLAADPVYSVPAETVAAQIHTMVEEDHTLHPLEPERAARGLEVIRYRELPGDDSEVTWSTWVEDDHQFSVGCHTRQTPTIPQEAACRMAVDSIELTGRV
ncbi:type VII secretion-associated protein [Corynebacterium sp. YIM 101645]|uniref:Type VII secretion-associated protein n=1 Tax=Corynebacterium lemuris TaxID=1859292 RepID=A0ABT2FTH1_9CORY|nr:type VII secretion-associated protein [Corynebacterium lemuris]MCS5478506.1 type VII secretion-associated protein [Corynebacterium lemuris]